LDPEGEHDMQSKKAELRELLEEFLLDSDVENAESLADEFVDKLDEASYFEESSEDD
jgi:DNA-directed RNA polymerase specialized sigma54-like protein